MAWVRYFGRKGRKYMRRIWKEDFTALPAGWYDYLDGNIHDM